VTGRVLSRWSSQPASADAWAGGVYSAILLIGLVLFAVSRFRPALMPFWGPFEFSWWEYLATSLALYWYARGLTGPKDRPSRWRQAGFVLGVLLMYSALQTHFDYMAQHLFSLNRIQQILVHDLGPFLIALSAPAATIARGTPRWAQGFARSRLARAVLETATRPVIASLLFVGVFYFWLIPPIHFRAMLDARFYAVMNASMVLDGLMFWLIVLDPRRQPAASCSFGTRAGMAFGVMTPQTLLGAVITLAPRDLYPSYTLCGRIFPIDAMTDQRLGGIISWIPPLLISAVAVLIVLFRIMRSADDGEAAFPSRAR
jgi:putative membrane protein